MLQAVMRLTLELPLVDSPMFYYVAELDRSWPSMSVMDNLTGSFVRIHELLCWSALMPAHSNVRHCQTTYHDSTS
jgi:hypothetical protein